jgi:hypothetical protein
MTDDGTTLIATDGGRDQQKRATEQTDGSHWLGAGTWLVDRRHFRPRIGVITDVNERERGMASRLSIYWRSKSYENISVSMALDRFVRGDWRVDDGDE